MEQFAIREAITAKLMHSQSRKQKMGEDLVLCMDNKWSIMVPNTFFDMIDRGIRQSWYERAHGGRQEDLTAEDPPTPKLRMPGLFEMPQKMTKEYSGYRLTLIRGTGREASNLATPDCMVNKFRPDFRDGGQVLLVFRTQHVDVEPDVVGQFAAIQGNEVSLVLVPPTAEEERMQAERAIELERQEAATKASSKKKKDPTFAGTGDAPAAETQEPATT